MKSLWSAGFFFFLEKTCIEAILNLDAPTGVGVGVNQEKILGSGHTSCFKSLEDYKASL